jgi:hypothetical protein
MIFRSIALPAMGRRSPIGAIHMTESPDPRRHSAALCDDWARHHGIDLSLALTREAVLAVAALLSLVQRRRGNQSTTPKD